MAIYDIEHPRTGQKITLEGDGVPTDADISEAFALIGKQPKVVTAGNPDASPAETERMRREFVAKTAKPETQIKEGIKSFGKAVMPYVRPVLEGGGAVAGGIVGTGSGALAGLGLGAIPGGVAGSALGYAGGAKLADLLETATGSNSRPQPQTIPGQMGQSLSDLATGATFEMGGQAAGNLIGRGVSAASKISRTPLADLAQSRARNVIEANKGLTTKETENVVNAAKLTNKLGVKLTPAQMTGKPSLASIEQGLAISDPEFAAMLNTQDTTAKQAALTRIQQNIGKGRQLPATQDLQTTGANTVDAVRDAQKAAKPIHEELYDAIPNTPQPTDKIKEAIVYLKKNFRPGDEDVFPSRAISRVEEAIQGPKPSAGGHGKPADPQILDAQGIPIRQNIDMTKKAVGFQDLHSLRKDIGRQIQDASTGMKPNRELAAKLQTIKSAIDDTIEGSMGADNQYKAAKDAFIEYADKYRTGAVNKVLAKGNESSGLRLADENINRQFFTPSGAIGLNKAIGKQAAKEQMKPFVVSDMLKSAAPDGVNFNVQSGINYIQKNRATLEQYGLVQEARSILKDQLPQEIEKILAKRAPDASGTQFFTAQDMRGILQKYGNTIKQLYGQETLQSFRDYNQLMGMIERKNLAPRSAGSNTAEKAMSVANLMMKEATGPMAKLTDGLVMAIAKGAGFGGGATMIAGNGSLKTAAIIGTLNAGRQLLKNADNQVAHIFTKILKEATLNPQVASDLMKMQRTGKVPATLQTIIDKHLITGAAITATSNQ
jgi:hypothetical protein